MFTVQKNTALTTEILISFPIKPGTSLSHKIIQFFQNIQYCIFNIKYSIIKGSIINDRKAIELKIIEYNTLYFQYL